MSENPGCVECGTPTRGFVNRIPADGGFLCGGCVALWELDLARDKILIAIVGTPHDPEEDITGGDPRLMEYGDLFEWSRNIITDLEDTFADPAENNGMSRDWEDSPMQQLTMDLRDALAEVVE